MSGSASGASGQDSATLVARPRRRSGASFQYTILEAAPLRGRRMESAPTNHPGRPEEVPRKTSAARRAIPRIHCFDAPHGAARAAPVRPAIHGIPRPHMLPRFPANRPSPAPEQRPPPSGRSTASPPLHPARGESPAVPVFTDGSANARLDAAGLVTARKHPAPGRFSCAPPLRAFPAEREKARVWIAPGVESPRPRPSRSSRGDGRNRPPKDLGRSPPPSGTYMRPSRPPMRMLRC